MKMIVFLLLASICSMCMAQTTYPCINDPWVEASVIANLDRELMCNPTTVVASLNPCLMNASCFNVLADFQIGTCFGVIVNGRLVFTMSSLASCGANATVVGKIVTYTYVMRQVGRTGSGGSNAIYPYDFEWTFKCEYNLSQELSSVVLNSSITKITVPELTTTGTFDTSIGLYNATTGGTAFTSGQIVSVFTQIYVRVSTSVAGYFVQVISVWATKTANPADTDRYNLLANGCPAPGSHFVVPFGNYNVSTANICMRAFTWKTGGPQFWVHVRICICCPDIQSCAGPPTCTSTGRRRRALHDSNMLPSPEKTETISLGPLSIGEPNQS